MTTVSKPMVNKNQPIKTSKLLVGNKKHVMQITVPHEREKEFSSKFFGKTIKEVLEGFDLLTKPVNCFAAPVFHPELASLLADYQAKPLGWLLDNALMQRLSWDLIIDFNRTHCPISFHVQDAGVGPSGHGHNYLRGNSIQLHAHHYAKANGDNLVQFQPEVVGQLTDTDLKLFTSPGSDRLFNYMPASIFKQIKMDVNKYTKEEMAKFLKRRNYSLAKAGPSVLSDAGVGTKTWWNDRDKLGFPAPRIIMEECGAKENRGLIFRII